MQSLLKINGYYVYVTGKTNDRLFLNNAVQLKVDQTIVNYIKKLENDSTDELSSEQNIKLYDLLIKKHSSSVFKNRPNAILKKMIDGKEIFKELDIENQKIILNEILKTTSVGGNGANLKKIEASPNSGVMTVGKIISNNTEFKLIEQSVTGIYEKEIDLLTV